jgi:flagellin-like hook-associated protein FlgL
MAMNVIQLTSGMRENLFSLQQTSKLMETTQKRLATGREVNSALDDPVNFFAAQGHDQRASDLAGRKDEMSEAIQTVKAANEGIESITELIAAAKSLANSAKSAENTTTQASLAGDFNEIMDQIDFLAADSGYKGINLVNGSTESLSIAFDANGDSTLTLTGFAGSTGGLSLADAGGSWAATSSIEASITALDAARDTLRTEAKTLSSNLNIINTRQDFTEGMINVLSDGAANLTQADMNKEGANMLMLQTRQALGTSSLSMASQAAQSVLRLF